MIAVLQRENRFLKHVEFHQRYKPHVHLCGKTGRLGNLADLGTISPLKREKKKKLSIFLRALNPPVNQNAPVRPLVHAGRFTLSRRPPPTS